LGELADTIGVGRALLLVGLVVVGAGVASSRLTGLDAPADEVEERPSPAA
jgi:hypothetical protein